MPRVAIATFGPEAPLPDATVRIAREEDARVVAALSRLGVEADAVPWTDPAADWARFDLVVPKTTWGYDQDLAGFLAWTARVEAATRMLNPPAVVRWNVDKRYLLDLAARGVAVPPTQLVPRGVKRDLAALLDERGWTDVVVKRTVAAGARGQARFSRAEAPRAGQEHLDRLLAAGDALVQPFLPAVVERGERSIVVLAGAVSHAVAKVPAAGSYLAHPGLGARTLAHEPTPAETDLARRAVVAVDGDVLYARVDVVDLPDGTPAIMELELVEPYLFLDAAPGAVERYASALAAATRA